MMRTALAWGRGMLWFPDLVCSTILTKSKSDLMTPRRYSMTRLLTIYIARELAALVPKASDGNPMVIVNCVS